MLLVISVMLQMLVMLMLYVHRMLRILLLLLLLRHIFPTTQLSWWGRLMPVLLTAPRQLGPHATFHLLTTTCQLSPTICLPANFFLASKKRSRIFFSQILFSARFFFPPELFWLEKSCL